MKVGAFEITALPDGTVMLPVDKLLTGNQPAVIKGLLARADLKAAGYTPKQGYLVAVAHVSFPGIGRMRADGKGYQWLPANDQSAP